MKTCVYCGAQINDEAQFCSFCGKVQPVEQPAEQPAANGGQLYQQVPPTDNGYSQVGGNVNQPNYAEQNQIPNGQAWGGQQQSANQAWGQQNPMGGAPIDGQPPKAPGMAIASMVLGIVSMVINPIMVCSILAIVFAVLVMKKQKEDPTVGGKGMATAGLVLGIVGTSFSLLSMLMCGSLGFLTF